MTDDRTVWNFRFDRFGQSFHSRLMRRKGKDLVVFLPSLRRPGATRVDYFDRISWAAELGCSCLFVADPGLGLDPELRGSWFQGGPAFYGIERLALDLRRIGAEFGFPEDRMLFYGSSQGGFAALALGAMLPGARVLAEAPQTDVRRYRARIEVNRMARACYGVQTAAAIPATLAWRLDLAALFARHPPARSHILVKDSDLHHLEDHIHPLLAGGNWPAITLEILTGDPGGAGHTALPAGLVLPYLTPPAKGCRPA